MGLPQPAYNTTKNWFANPLLVNNEDLSKATITQQYHKIKPITLSIAFRYTKMVPTRLEIIDSVLSLTSVAIGKLGIRSPSGILLLEEKGMGSRRGIVIKSS